MSSEDSADLREQRRSRRVAMSRPELDDFLTAERTCRVGTAGPDGPHVTPLWFVWDGSLVWIYSIVGSQRWVDLDRDPRVAIVVDAGHDYFELCGAEIRGTAAVVGEVPRTGEPASGLTAAERLFAAKYQETADMIYDGRHAWLCITPEKIVSWDFRKIASAGG
jgi:Pyridoxamine 5'-phosphate oxidase